MRNHQQFKEICVGRGWKCTSQRLAVYDFVCDNLTHPGVDVVWEHIKKTLPTVTRESIYRILNEFSEAGLINRLDHIDSARYDSCIGAHGHFICEQCKEIFDFDWPQGATLPQELLTGKIRHMEFRIVGLCKMCERKRQCDPSDELEK